MSLSTHTFPFNVSIIPITGCSNLANTAPVWMNTVFADGPRQVINAMTLYSVMQLDLIPGGKNAANDDGSSSIGQFFNNIKILADDSKLQAVVLFGMLFTLVIWVLSVLKLISAIILYLLFLFHHIPAEDGTLSRYCRRKVAKRLKRIVHRKNNKALAKGLKLQSRPPTAPSLLSSDSTPTLPSISTNKRPTLLSRTTTQTTLPPYSRSTSFTTLDQDPTLPGLAFDAKHPLSRTRTNSSAISESSSLAGNAAAMGYSPLDSRQPAFHPVPPVPPIPTNIPQRMLTPHRPGSRASPASHSSGESRNTRAGHAQSINNTRHNGSDAGYRGLNEVSTGHQSYHRSYTPAPQYAPRAMTGTPNYDSFGRTHESAHYDPYRPSVAPRDNFGQSYYHEEDHYSNPPPSRSQATHTSYRPVSPVGTPALVAPRTLTPTRSGNPAPQGGFAAFNPAPPYASSPGYPSSNHVNDATASGPHNVPPSPSFNRPDTHRY